MERLTLAEIGTRTLVERLRGLLAGEVVGDEIDVQAVVTQLRSRDTEQAREAVAWYDSLPD